MHINIKRLVLITIVLSSPLYATDKAREQRWVDQTIEQIFDGEPVFLEVADHRVYSIYTEPDSPSKNGLIVLHGTGFHPDYEQVVRPLRVALASSDWHTLSIQLPLLSSEARYNDYISVYPEVPPRLDAATQYLQNKGVNNISIVAHSQGATMAAYYVARHEHSITSLVLIGMSAQHRDMNINSAESLKKISIPVLDIYGSKDFPAVLQTVDIRSNAAAHNEHYQQRVIDGAYHFFEIREDELIDAVSNWLTPWRK